MNRDLLAVMDHYERDRGIDRDTLVETIKSAILTAAKKKLNEEEENLRVEMDEETADITIYLRGKELPASTFGRIAAQTAKQVLIQKLNEAERDVICKDFTERVGTVVTAGVEHEENGTVFMDLGKTSGIVPSRERSPNDHYRPGTRMKCYILDVQRTSRGVQIILSRSHHDLVKEMFETQVPEIVDGVVKVIGVAREAGYRTKLGVHSERPDVDCVGACVGIKGSRVKMIVQELGGEKIDIIPWSEDPVLYITRALSPAQIAAVHLAQESRYAEVVVDQDQLSLAIGKRGLNVKLASKLTGWRLDIRSQEQIDRIKERMEEMELTDLPGVGQGVAEAMKEEGYEKLTDLYPLTLKQLVGIPGVGDSTAEKIRSRLDELADPKYGLEQDGHDTSRDEETSESEESE